jgi:hypothetical protein
MKDILLYAVSNIEQTQTLKCILLTVTLLRNKLISMVLEK